MMWRALVWGGLGGLLAASAAGAADRSEEALRADQAELERRLVGLWSNDMQVLLAEEAGALPADAPARREIAIAKTAAGGLVATLDDGSSFAFRLAPNAAARGVDAVFSESCVITLRKGAGSYGGVAGEGCGPPAPRSVLIGQGRMSFAPSGGAEPLELVRARAFICWAGVLRGARAGDAGLEAAPDDWWRARGLRLHDQGGEAALVTDESPPRAFVLKMRRPEWPAPPQRPSLVLYVHEKGDARALSYAWAPYDGDRVGLNLRWLQAGCSLVEPGG